MTNKFLIFSLLLINLNLYSQSSGIVIEAMYASTKECSSDSMKSNIHYSIRNDILRVDLYGKNSNSSIIFQPASEKIWVLYHHEQLFYSMTGEELKTLEQEVLFKANDFMEKMNALDSNARNEIKMIWPDGNPFMFEDPEYSLVNKKDTLISQLLCDKYSGKLNTGVTQYFYSSNLKTTGIKDSELEILKQFSQFMGKGVKALSGNMDFANIYKKEVGGYPILLENFSGDALCNSYWIRFIYRKELSNSFFEVPLIYGKMDNPLGNR